MWHLRILFLKFWEICTESGAYFVLSGESGLMTSVFILQNPTFLCTNTSLMFTDLEGTSFSKPSHVLQERHQLFITKSSSSEVSWHLYTSLSFSTVSLQKHNTERTEWNKQLQKHSTVSVGLFLLRFQFWAHRCCWHVQLGGNTHHLKGRWSSAATCGHWTVLQQQCDHCLHAAVNISAAPPAATA